MLFLRRHLCLLLEKFTNVGVLLEKFRFCLKVLLKKDLFFATICNIILGAKV